MTKKWHIIDQGNGQKDLPEASCRVLSVHYNPATESIYYISTDEYSARWKLFNAYDERKPENSTSYNSSIIAWCYVEDEEAEIFAELGVERRAKMRADYLAQKRAEAERKVKFIDADEPLEAKDEVDQ